jgi:hypothetical protein
MLSEPDLSIYPHVGQHGPQSKTEIRIKQMHPTMSDVLCDPAIGMVDRY